jgi:hypothetical protein
MLVDKVRFDASSGLAINILVRTRAMLARKEPVGAGEWFDLIEFLLFDSIDVMLSLVIHEPLIVLSDGWHFPYVECTCVGDIPTIAESAHGAATGEIAKLNDLARDYCQRAGIVITAKVDMDDAENPRIDYDAARPEHLAVFASLFDESPINDIEIRRLVARMRNERLLVMATEYKPDVIARIWGRPNDGPIEPDKFRYAETTIEGLTAMPFRLVQYLWCKTRTAYYDDDLSRAIWCENGRATQQAVATHAKQFNTKCEDADISLRIKCDKVKAILMEKSSENHPLA